MEAGHGFPKKTWILSTGNRNRNSNQTRDLALLLTSIQRILGTLTVWNRSCKGPTKRSLAISKIWLLGNSLSCCHHGLQLIVTTSHNPMLSRTQTQTIALAYIRKNDNCCYLLLIVFLSCTYAIYIIYIYTYIYPYIYILPYTNTHTGCTVCPYFHNPTFFREVGCGKSRGHHRNRGRSRNPGTDLAERRTCQFSAEDPSIYGNLESTWTCWLTWQVALAEGEPMCGRSWRKVLRCDAEN